jgi:hypothetical protein
MGAEGILDGMIIPGIVGEPVNLAEHLILAGLIVIWQFIPVYRSMVLPPTWILDTGLLEEPVRELRWRRGLLPFLALIPFLIYLILIMLIING